VDTDRWVSFMLAELASHRGDYAEAARCCEGVLATIAGNRAPWWDSLRAQVTSSLAVAVLRLGDEARCARLLTEALDAAARWRDHAALATVLDACAVYAQLRADRPDPELPARLLGAAAAVRGAFDESGLDAPGIRRTAKSVLGEDRFTRAYAQGLASGYDSAITLARTLLSG
jgi:hypothetical protein